MGITLSSVQGTDIEQQVYKLAQPIELVQWHDYFRPKFVSNKYGSKGFGGRKAGVLPKGSIIKGVEISPRKILGEAGIWTDTRIFFTVPHSIYEKIDLQDFFGIDGEQVKMFDVERNSIQYFETV